MSLGTRVRDLTDPVTGMVHPRLRRAGALLLVGSVLFAVSGYLGHVPFVPPGGTVVSARFADSSLVVRGSLVRIRGVDVGKVTAIRHPVIGGPALVEMRVQDAVARTLRSDARAAIWWRTLFGGRSYVELYPGNARRPLTAPIRLARTETQVEFDTLLKTLDERARPAIQTQLREFRRGLRDARAVGRVIERVPGAAREAAPALRALRGQWSGDLTRLVRRTGRVAGAIARDEAALGRLLDSAQLTFAVTAARRADLAATLHAIPPAAARIRAESLALPRTLDRLDPIVQGAMPAARRLDAAARALRPTTVELARGLRTLRPLLVDLAPTARELGAAGVAGAPLVRDLLPTAERLHKDIVPFLRSRDAESGREVHQLLGPTIAGFDAVTSMFDVNGNAARIGSSVGPNSVGPLPCETYFLEPHTQQRIVCEQLGDLLRSITASLTRGARR